MDAGAEPPEGGPIACPPRSASPAVIVNRLWADHGWALGPVHVVIIIVVVLALAGFTTVLHWMGRTV